MDWPTAVIGSIGTVAVFAAVIVAVWQAFKTWQAKVAARVAVTQDEAYRKLAMEATAAQRAVVAEQQRIAEELAQLRERLSTVEKLLRDVG